MRSIQVLFSVPLVHYDEGDVVSGLLPSEEVADMRQRMEEIEAELEGLHAGTPELQCVCVCVCACVRACVRAYFNMFYTRTQDPVIIIPARVSHDFLCNYTFLCSCSNANETHPTLCILPSVCLRGGTTALALSGVVHTLQVLYTWTPLCTNIMWFNHATTGACVSKLYMCK